jgi:lipopolysaccharide transport system permease protein
MAWTKAKAAPRESTAQTELVENCPPRRWQLPAWRELWERRELLYFFIWRDIKVRYKQTVLGAAWAVLQPFLTMVVFSLFFGRLAGLASDGQAYPVFAYAALVPWIYFANAVGQAASSLTANESTITKVYFPRLLIPAAAVFSGLLDFFIAFLTLLGMLAVYGVRPGPQVWLLPLFALLAVASALGVGLWLAALNVRYRDVRYAIPFLLQAWMFLTPVAFSMQIVPARWQALYALNPMVSVVQGFRLALTGDSPLPPEALLASIASALVLLVGGALYFRSVEDSFADVV